MSRGKPLEHAMGVAFVHYRKAQRADVRKQEIGRTWSGQIRSGAPLDFLGVCRELGGAVAFEAKECDARFELREDHLTEAQRDALDSQVLLGAAAFLVVDVTSVREVYLVDWQEVQRFRKAPWRSSLSLQWLQAFGELVRETDRDNPKKRAAWVLDAKPHPGREAAYIAVCHEKARAGDKLVELWPAEIKLRKQRTNAEPLPAPGTEAYAERIMKAAQDGIARQLGASARKGKWNPRRRAR